MYIYLLLAIGFVLPPPFHPLSLLTDTPSSLSLSQSPIGRMASRLSNSRLCMPRIRRFILWPHLPNHDEPSRSRLTPMAPYRVRRCHIRHRSRWCCDYPFHHGRYCECGRYQGDAAFYCGDVSVVDRVVDISA